MTILVHDGTIFGMNIGIYFFVKAAMLRTIRM